MLEIVVLSPVDFEISLLFSCRSLFAFFFQKESRSALTLHMKLITCKETPVFLFWGFAEDFTTQPIPSCFKDFAGGLPLELPNAVVCRVGARSLSVGIVCIQSNYDIDTSNAARAMLRA
nr:uncharacterized protein LOC103421826 isoform X4 [Malus domestica]